MQLKMEHSPRRQTRDSGIGFEISQIRPLFSGTIVVEEAAGEHFPVSRKRITPVCAFECAVGLPDRCFVGTVRGRLILGFNFHFRCRNELMRAQEIAGLGMAALRRRIELDSKPNGHTTGSYEYRLPVIQSITLSEALLVFDSDQ